MSGTHEFEYPEARQAGPDRGDLRAPGQRPLPLDGGRRQRRTGGLAGGAGRVVLRAAGRLARAGRAGRAGPGAARRRRSWARRPGAGSGPSSPSATPGRSTPCCARRWSDGPGRGARRPDGHRPVRADHAGRLAAGQGGAAARLPAVRGRRRGIPAEGAGRRDRFGGGRADRPVPVLQRGLAAGRQGVLLHAPAAAVRSRRARASTTGGSTCTRSARMRTRTCSSSVRAGTRPTTTTPRSAGTAAGWPSPRPGARRRATTCGWPTCRRLTPPSPELRVVQEGVDAQTSVRVGRDGRLVPVHRPGRAPGPDRGGRSGFRRPGRPGGLAGADRRGSRGGAARVRDPGRFRAGAAGPGRVLDPARAERDHRA